MSAEVWAILGVGIALGGLMWRMLRSMRQDMDHQFKQVDKRFEQVDRRFEQVAECFREVRRQLARFADDHNGLARELSELRGEIRTRFDARPGPAPAD